MLHAKELSLYALFIVGALMMLSQLVKAVRTGLIWNAFSISLPLSCGKTVYPTVSRLKNPVLFWTSILFWTGALGLCIFVLWLLATNRIVWT